MEDQIDGFDDTGWFVSLCTSTADAQSLRRALERALVFKPDDQALLGQLCDVCRSRDDIQDWCQLRRRVESGGASNDLTLWTELARLKADLGELKAIGLQRRALGMDPTDDECGLFSTGWSVRGMKNTIIGLSEMADERVTAWAMKCLEGPRLSRGCTLRTRKPTNSGYPYTETMAMNQKPFGRWPASVRCGRKSSLPHKTVPI